MSVIQIPLFTESKWRTFVSAMVTRFAQREVSSAVLLAVCGLTVLSAPTMLNGQTTLTVNFSSSQGAVLHGASGWLYGQGESGVPTQNLMAPLYPKMSAQKPPNGLQHAGGDVTQVIGDFVASNGSQMELYLQDEYQTWPYPSYPGATAYASVVSTAVTAALANPDHAYYSYNLFNEPDGQWYGTYSTGMTNLPQFESDWSTIYKTVRGLNSSAIIVGPSFSSYNATQYQEFLTYAKANNVLPNVISWHELSSSFYSEWSTHLSSIQSIESNLGISLPIVINEYGLSSGTLGNPGNSVQWIAALEAAKAYGCIAYWSQPGSLNGMAADATNNQATGTWWLYKWYGDMAGNTYAVTPPNENVEGLSGLASASTTNNQARIIFGGGSGTVNVVLNDLSSLSFVGSTVHATVWGVDATAVSSDGDGWVPSAGPYYIQEANYTVSGGSTTVSVPSTKAGSAYLIIVTPNKSLSTVGTAGKYEAEYAHLYGNAEVTYGSNTGYSGTYFVQGYGTSNNACTEWDINAATGGYYNVDLRYSSPLGNTSLEIYLNGAALESVSLPETASASTWSDVTDQMYLIAGINRLGYCALGSSASNGVQLDYIDLTSSTGTIDTYQADSSVNTLAGTAVGETYSSAPGGTMVGFIGQGAANYLQFNNVYVAAGGLYRMIVYYAADESYVQGGPVFRFAQISVNGGTSTVYFQDTYSWTNWVAQEVDVNLNAGENTIRFSNSTTSPSPNINSGWAPNIAQIQIAWPY